MLAWSVTLQLASEETKFEKPPAGPFGHADAPLLASVTPLACGATGALVGKPGVPLFDQTRVYRTPIGGVTGSLA
jgi:hypothetical protein